MINKDRVFPFTVYSYDVHNWAWSSDLAKQIWQRIKEKGQTWYSLDLEVTGERDVIIHVRTMADSFHGGIGHVVLTKKVTVTDEDEIRQLNEHIEKRCTLLAAEEFERRKEEEYNQQVLAVRMELFGV